LPDGHSLLDHPSIELVDHGGFRFIDHEPGRNGTVPDLISVSIRGLAADDVAVTRLLELAASEPLGQHCALVLSDGPLDLEQELVVGIIGDGAVQEDHVAASAAKLLQQQDLIGIFAGKSIRAEYRHDIDGSVADGIAQAVEPRPVQTGAAIALIAKDMHLGKRMILGAGPIPQSRELAIDSLLTFLALG
jgi:hypothetical protein